MFRQETATWGGCDLGNSGVWERDYGWGVRGRPFGARGRSSVRYGTRLGDLKNKQPNQTKKRELYKELRSIPGGLGRRLRERESRRVYYR